MNIEPFQRLYNFINSDFNNGEIEFTIDDRVRIFFHTCDYDYDDRKSIECDIFDIDQDNFLCGFELDCQNQGIITNKNECVLARFKLGSPENEDFTFHMDSMGITIDRHVDQDFGLRVRMIIDNLGSGVNLMDAHHVTIWLSICSIDIIGLGDLVKLNLDNTAINVTHPNFPIEQQTIVHIP